MADEKKTSKYRGFTPAQAEAHKRYMEGNNYVEIKVRMTKERRSEIQAYTKERKESVTAFINRAIDEQMQRDKTEKS